MTARLSRSTGKAYDYFPSFPLDLALQMASVGGPEHTRVKRHRGYIIQDEFEGVMVAGKFQAVGELPEQDQANGQHGGKGNLDPNQQNQQSDPGNRCFELAINRAGRATYQPVEVFLP